MQYSFTGPLWFWRGPAPHYFVSMPQEASDDLTEQSAHLSYGWGAIPAEVSCGDVTWTTAVFPKDGRYIVPVRAAVRTALGVDLDDEVSLMVRIGD